MFLPGEAPLVRLSASGGEVRECGHVEIMLSYCKEFANCGISMEYARLAWHRYFVDGADTKILYSLEELNALTNSACPAVFAETANVAMPEARSPSMTAGSTDKKDWTVGDLVEVDR